MGEGGKGGKSESSVEIDPRLEEGAVQTLAGALRSAALPYRSNRGVTAAAFSPMQMAAFEGANAAASAYGMPSVQGDVQSYLPAAQDAGGGFYGYSPTPILDNNINASLSEADIVGRAELLESYLRSANRVEPDSAANAAIMRAIRATPGQDGSIYPNFPEGYDQPLPPPDGSGKGDTDYLQRPGQGTTKTRRDVWEGFFDQR